MSACLPVCRPACLSVLWDRRVSGAGRADAEGANLPTRDVMQSMDTVVVVVVVERRRLQRVLPVAAAVTDSTSRMQIWLFVSVLTPSSVWENEQDGGKHGSAD